MKFHLLLILATFSVFLNAQNIPLYVGTYTNTDSEGIYSYNFNTRTGDLSAKKLLFKTVNPSFITFSSDKKFIYAVGEVDQYLGSKSGFISAYKMLKNGEIQFLNSVSSNGAHPCHAQLNSLNSLLAVSNYTGGTISLHKINESGFIEPANQVINHNSNSNKSHAHAAKFFKNKLFIADLGLDLFAHYELTKNVNSYSIKDSIKMKNGGGPRHFELSKNGNFIYVLNELNSTVTVLKNQKNSYIPIQDITTLKEGFDEFNAGADIHLSENERYLYASNRGENSIVVFKRNLKSGMLQKIQSIHTGINWPRNFTVAPNGKFLLVANERSNSISVFSINKNTGTLVFKNTVEAPTPVCLLF